jgi:hypothetical protein
MLEIGENKEAGKGEKEGLYLPLSKEGRKDVMTRLACYREYEGDFDLPPGKK